MNKNEEIINRFYTAFQKLDYKTMNACYAEEVIFYDPVFETLINEELWDMWAMLCTNAKDFSLTFSEVEADEEYGTCTWIATYTFLAYFFNWRFITLFYISYGITIVKTILYILIGWLQGKKMN